VKRRRRSIKKRNRQRLAASLATAQAVTANEGRGLRSAFMGPPVHTGGFLSVWCRTFEPQACC
jgi:hypothetical protein